ncbi:MAG: ABC transporter substrate-binding protein [Elusimicrobia bacterium]|nr:ABC transporter substrate-binding protein [Elusimicrobiota bacterium]
MKLRNFIALLLILCSRRLNADYQYQQIISLAPIITKSLCLLGVENKIVGISFYCKELPEVKDKEIVGTFTNMNLEKIISLKPDIVLCSSIMDNRQIEKLRNVKVNVVTFSPAKKFSELCEFFLQLSEIVNKKQKANKIIKEATEKINIVKQKMSKLPKLKVIVQIGANPLFVANKDYFINDLIEFAGGINIAKNAKTGLYSREEVLKQNPDVIIILTMGIQGDKEKKTWQKYKTINAVKNNRIYIIDSDKVCSPTPESFVEVLKEIAEILHK